MSNPVNAINQIKDLMKQFGFLNEEPTLLSFKLQDNTIVETLKLAVGEKITKLNEAFEKVALADGDYKLDNLNVSVKDGVISAVKEIFLNAKLVDGTPIKVEGEEVVEGAKVMVVTEEGEIPAPDGVHELEGGMKVETKAGVIAKIEEEVEEEEPKVEIEVEAEKMPAQDEAIKELYSLLKDMMEKVSGQMKKMEEKMEKVEGEFEAFKKQPAGKKVSDGKVDFSNTNNETDLRTSKIDAILALRNK